MVRAGLAFVEPVFLLICFPLVSTALYAQESIVAVFLGGEF